jgi:4'-phosphopantetheinyl transferase
VTTVWLSRGEPDLPAGDGWLTAAERDRAGQMRFTKRRTEFLVARFTAKDAIARSLRARHGTVEPARIEVRHHTSGAPEPYLDGRPLPIPVSLTDRAGWAVCLVGDGAAVGCDLELVEPRSAGFVSDFLTDSERRVVASQEHGRGRDLAANLFWSAKESALKVLRSGLRRDTRSVEVVPLGLEALGREWMPLAARTTDGRAFAGWWRCFGCFVLTVASEREAPPPVSLEEPPALATAGPLHTWLERPLTGIEPSPAPARR